MTSKKDIAIIGGGAVGPLLLAYISNEAERQSATLNGVTFHLIDPKGFGNGGIAYGKCNSQHVLNSVIQEMAPFRENAFLDFLKSSRIPANQEEFYSRSLYKKFIKKDLVDRSIKVLECHGARFEEHKVAARIQQTKNGRFNVLNPCSGPISLALCGLSNEDIILTVGYGPNNRFTPFKNQSGFVHSIYDTRGELSLIERETKLQNPSNRIAVIGSGPGLYDVVNELPHPFREFFVFSGSGKGLGVRDLKLEKNEQSLPPQRLLSLGKDSKLTEVVSALKQEFTIAANGRSKRRIGLDIQKNIKQILMQLDKGVAEAFRQSSEYAPIKHIATPVPQKSKQKLDTFSPHFVKARLENDQIKKQLDGSYLINTGDNQYEVDVVINATGHGRHNSSIIQSLKKQGLAQVNPITNALETDETEYRLKSSGISVIGPATHVGTDGMESFACYTERCAKALVRQINSNLNFNRDRDFRAAI